MNSEITLNIEERFQAVKQRVDKACQQAGRPTGSVTLIGASKCKSSALLNEFAQHGLNDIGENYLQEALKKRKELEAAPLNWHFIGHIQSNKTKTIAENFSWVHGVDRFKIAQRIATQNPNPSKAINLLVQLNIDNEDSKGGITLDQAPQLCAQIADLENVRIRGFMMIPKPRNNVDAQRAVFSKAQEQLSLTNQHYGLNLDSLSMGMSRDIEAAISAGSTMVRIGTDLFGARD